MAKFKSRTSPFLDRQAAATKTLATPFLRESQFKHTFEATVADIQPDPQQSRKIFDDDEIVELARSIDSRGLLQPILVRQDDNRPNGWIIVAGERRWRAVSTLGWEHIPAIEYEGDYVSANLVENLLREDLSPVEEAQGVQKLLAYNGWSQSEAGRQLCIPQSRVNKLIHILDLPENFLTLAAEKKIPLNTLVAISRETQTQVREEMMAKALEGGLTVLAAHAARTEKKPRNQVSDEENFSKSYVNTAQKFIKNINIIKEKSRHLTDEEIALLHQSMNAINDILAEFGK
ncbi:ParB/RepB/Spo0J family partition protein (plasmid) [Acetobacter orientalis]|uniref:ParB/RepB/Spo0J family partition protein n=1 Tax=Acetobacter orientalis TaxID=146474 RepID=UPI003870B191